MSKVRFLGLDVHAGTIAASVAEPDGEVRPLGIIPNRLESVRKSTAAIRSFLQARTEPAALRRAG